MPSTEVRNLTPFTAANIAAGDVLIGLDVSAAAGSSLFSITSTQLARASILLASSISPDKLDTIVFNDVSGSTIGSATLADVIAAGLQRGTATSGVGADLTIQGQNAQAGSGGNIILIPGDNASTGSDGRIRVVHASDNTKYGSFYYNGGSFSFVSESPGDSGEVMSFLYGNDSVFNVQIGGTKTGGGRGYYIQDSMSFTSNGDVGLLRAAAGVLDITNVNRSYGSTIRSVPITVAEITANQNNWNPGVSMFYRISSDASRTITGLSISQVNGQFCAIINVGSNDIVFSHESASSTAANRFLTTTGTDVTIAANGRIDLLYDATSSRWRIF